MISNKINLASPHRLTGLMAAILLAVAGQTKAGIINAASAALSDVQAAVNLATDGDTVAIPAGSATWVGNGGVALSVTKGITLQGTTTVVNAGTGTPTITDGTVIYDNVTPSAGNNNASIVQVSLTANTGQYFRMTGITFKGLRTITTNGLAFSISGTAPGSTAIGNTSVPQFQIDHCYFNQIHNGLIDVSGWMYGVIDNNEFDVINTPTARITFSGWDNQGSGWGSWADPPYFGSNRFLFFETNTCINYGPQITNCDVDTQRGGRFVTRYNYYINANLFYHGGVDTGSGSANYRNGRAVEIYKNQFVQSTTRGLAQSSLGNGQNRGGSLLYWGNTYTGNFTGSMALKIYRLTGFGTDKPGGWGGANGTSAWDYNDPHGLYTTGKVLSSVNTDLGSTSVTVSGVSWTPNQWAGYSIINTTSSGADSSFQYSANCILSNTSDTLTLYGSNYGGSPPIPTFNLGDTFAIYRVLVALDQPGRGQSALIAGSPPVVTSGPGSTWPKNMLEPCYSWLNKLNASQADIIGAPILVENRDFFNQNSSFNPGVTTNLTSGIGVGTEAQRPSNCTPGTDITGVTPNPPGVGYWATDTNTFYVCTATDTWTQYYQPYTYPHPLASGLAVPAPSPPMNLRVQP